jgi:hypothetical protein
MKCSTILMVAAALAATLANAHPEFVGEHANELEQERKRSEAEGEAGRSLIRGTAFYGSPVHEEQTIRSVTLSNILGRAYSIHEQRDRAFVRGVFWNDDPKADLWSNDKSKGPDSLGAAWYSNFLVVKQRATAEKPHFFRGGDDLLGRSHFGDLQFLHAMADGDEVAPEETRRKIMAWLEFAYRVAKGDIPGGQRVADVRVPGIAALFEKDQRILEGTVAELFRDADVKEVAAGSFLHVLQDSYAGGHVQREKKDRRVNTLDYFGRGGVLRFHSYAKQDEDRHKADDRRPPTLRLNVPLERLGDDPVFHGAHLLRMMFGADGKPAADWTAAEKYLREQVFAFAPGVQDSSAGECYVSGQLPAHCGTGSTSAGSRDAAGLGKFALLIGINEYLSPKMKKLSGAVNDVRNMKSVLMTNYGFAERDIRVLLDRDATRAGILAAVEQLKKDVKPGSVVVIHFSGHGSQEPDTDGDEPDDGADETIVPHDSRVGDVYDIPDDLIAGWLRDLGKVTPHVLLVLDSCHSGTGARLGGAELTSRWVEPDPRRGAIRRPPGGRGGDRASAVSEAGDSGRWVAISGSRAEELSYELQDDAGQIHGALTYYLVRALRTAKPDMTYRDLHERISREVNLNKGMQHPEIDGPGKDSVVLGTGSVVPQPFFTARAYADGIAIDAGLAHGVSEKTTFRLYPPGTRTFERTEHIGIAEITSVFAYSSVAKLAGDSIAAPGMLRAVVHQRSVGDFAWRVYLDPMIPAPAASAIRAAAVTEPAISLVGKDGDAHTAITASGNELVVMQWPDVVVGRFRADQPDLKAAMERLLKGWLTWFRVLGITNPGVAPAVKVELLDAGKKPVDAGCVGGELQMRLSNNSTSTIFVQMLTLDFGGGIRSVELSQGRTSVPLAPGASLPPFTVRLEKNVPEGKRVEYFKFVATQQAVSLEALAQDGVRSDNLVQRLFQERISGGARTEIVPSEAWSSTEQRLTTHTCR